jgi:hypothetical protein
MSSPNRIVDEWSDFNPQYILEELHLIPPDECPGNKSFFSTYKKFDKLNDQQVGKMEVFFSLLSGEQKTQVTESISYSFHSTRSRAVLLKGICRI